jgi:nucleoside-diphosphate-sugar epimerase
MRILVAGATGVLGRATLPHLKRHDVLGLTRAREKLPLLRALGAEGIVCDVYDSGELVRLAQERRPQVVVNFVTDLSAGISEANNRARREGGKNLVSAAEAAGSRRLILESVASPLGRPAAEALEQMEQTALESPLEVLILRFGRLWGPATFYQEPPEPPAIHIEDARHSSGNPHHLGPSRDLRHRLDSHDITASTACSNALSAARRSVEGSGTKPAAEPGLEHAVTTCAPS